MRTFNENSEIAFNENSENIFKENDGTLLNGNNGKTFKEYSLKAFKDFMLEEDAIGVVEMILILAVLISLVVIFKKQLTDLVNDIFRKITKKAGEL